MFGFWKPTTTRSASSWVDSPAVGCPSIVSSPRQRPADRRGRQPGRDQAERRLARLVRPDQPDDLAVVEPQIDVVEDLVRVAGVAVRDPVQLQHRRPQGSDAETRRTRAPMATSNRSEQREPDDELGPGVRHPPEQVALAGLAERPDLQGEAPLLDLGQGREDDRRRERQEAAEPGADAALGVEAAGPLGAGDDARPLDHRRHRLERRRGDEREPRRESPPLEIEDEAPRIRRQPEQPDRRRDREEPDERLGREVDAFDRRVERPDREEHVLAGPREHADEDDRDRDRQRQQERRSAPAGAATPATAAAGSIARKMIASGPMYPPRTNAPIDSTVAMTAFVSGFRRWYGDGVAGARLARNAASSAGGRRRRTTAVRRRR